METGKVKFFKKDKGYGFIIPDNDQQEVFFHKSALGGIESIEKDTRVIFEVENGKKGIQAKNVEIE